MTAHKYTLDEIDGMRGTIWLLNFEAEDSALSMYEKKDIVEKILRTYMSQGVTWDKLAEKYRNKLKKEKK